MRFNIGEIPPNLLASSIFTSSEIAFVQNLSYRAGYNANNVVLMNQNNGGSPLQVLRVKADGSGLEFADIGSGGGGILGTISTGQIAFGTGTNTIGGDNNLTWDNVAKKLTTSALKIGTLGGVLKATAGDISGGATTSDLPEGTNLYYTDARARNAISANAPIIYNSATGVIGLSTPLAVSYGGTGLSSLGTANQLLGVNSGATALEYKNIASLLNAGSGISISGTSIATISNTGVLSLNNLTGSLTLQGTTNQINISIAGSTITLSTPQDISPTSSPTFAGLTIGTLTGLLKASSGSVSSVPAPTGDVVGTTDTQTLINKRIQKRTFSTTTATSLTPDISQYDLYQLTALSSALTINNPIGDPVLGDVIVILIKDNGTSRTLSWGTAYKGIGATLPTATTAGKTMEIIAEYDGTNWLTSYTTEI